MRQAIERYHRLLAADPVAARAQSEALRAAFTRCGVTFGSQPMPSPLRPHFVGRTEWERLRSTASSLMQVIRRVAQQVFDGDLPRLCSFLGVPDDEAAWVALEPGSPQALICRLDAFLTAEGPRFVEVNCEAPVGFGYGDRMAALFRELPVFRAFEDEAAVTYQRSDEVFVRAIAAYWRASGGTGRPRLAIVNWVESATRADEEILRQALVARGFDCVLADPREMDVHRGRLHAAGLPVDLVYRRAALRELLGREIEVHAFLGAYRHRLCPFVNSFRCRVAEDKAFLAILTDESFAHLLTPDERQLVERAVPWTRRVAECRTRMRGGELDLVPYVLAHRESLVLKPTHESGGQSVVVGSEVGWPEWDAAVRGALAAPWVVQERVTIPEEPFPVIENGALEIVPLKVNVGPFYTAEQPAGAIARVSRGAVVNVSAGGGSVPSFVVG